MSNLKSPAIKPSYATLEFWLSVAAFLVSVVLASGAFDGADPNSAGAVVAKVLGGIGALLSSLGYAGLRTVQKANELKAGAVAALASDPSKGSAK